MMTPLAQSRRRRHFVGMIRFFTTILICVGFGFAAPALAQEETTPDAPALESPLPGTEIPDAPAITPVPEFDDTEDGKEKRKDLTIRSESDRAEILDELFIELNIAPDEEAAELIAEEIWAVFLQSRSASVDFLLLRGISAQNRGDLVLARRMFDHVTRLSPEYAEGWSRSARLAIDENDLQRAATDVTQALVYEPRHFYALWTMGNILEKLGRTDKAFEAYEAAHKLYPQHEEIKVRVEYLRDGAQGQAL